MCMHSIFRLEPPLFPTPLPPQPSFDMYSLKENLILCMHVQEVTDLTPKFAKEVNDVLHQMKDNTSIIGSTMKYVPSLFKYMTSTVSIYYPQARQSWKTNYLIYWIILYIDTQVHVLLFLPLRNTFRLFVNCLNKGWLPVVPHKKNPVCTVMAVL